MPLECRADEAEGMLSPSSASVPPGGPVPGSAPAHRPRSRRRRIATVAVLVPVLVIAGCAAFVGVGAIVSGVGSARPVDTVGAVEFDAPLAVPPLAPSTVDPDGTRVFTLQPQRGTSEFRAGVSTETLGYNGTYLGPTLRAERGERVRVDVQNALADPTTLHWHGMHLPAAIDGGPHQTIAPGGRTSPEWTIDQPAATLWYHPHPHGETEDQVARGLAGLFLLGDETEAQVDLPREYGVDDIPVVVQDMSIGGSSSTGGGGGFVGALGNEVLVNGTLAPYLDVSTSSVRLRLLNASTARTYNFGLSDGREFAMIASDGGLLAEPHTTDGIRLSPGERAEIVVSMTPGERVVLRSNPPDLGMPEVTAAGNGGTDRFDVLELRAAPTLKPVPDVPDTLAEIDDLSATDAVTTRRFELNGFTINNAAMDMRRIDEVVTLGTTEEWVVENGMAMPHNFHIHDVQFQVESVGGEPPGPELSGWKDTIYLAPDVEYRLVMRFEDYADPDLPYMYHCHLLAHEDSGMMGQFVVVERGERAGTPPDHDGAATGTSSGGDTSRESPGAPTPGETPHGENPDGFGPRETGTEHVH